MGIYINDTKKHTVRHYCTTPKIEKAIETLLLADDDLVGSETHEGYEVVIQEINAKPSTKKQHCRRSLSPVEK